MMKSCSLIFVFAMSIVCVSAGDEKLVPARFEHRTDASGMTWDINPNGQISDGTNDCFDTGLALYINGNGFNARDRKQTNDGEFVIAGQANNLNVIRRILLEPERNAVRYLEIISNPTNQKQSVIVEVHSTLGNGGIGSFWNDGKIAVAGSIPKKCSAVAALHQQNANRPGVIWIIGDSKASTAPLISINDQRQYIMRYQFDLPAKQSRAIFHYVLQRPKLQANQIADNVTPLWKNRLIKPKIPKIYADQIINFTMSRGDEAELLPVIAQLMDRVGIDEFTGKTLVGIGRSEAERMTGNISGGPLIAAGEFGEVSIPVDQLAGSEGSGFRTLLHLTNGETINATSLQGELRLETEAGVELPVNPSQVTWIVAKENPDKNLHESNQVGVLILTDGSRLAISKTSQGLPVISAFGQAQIAFDKLAYIERINEPPCWLVTMRDGSKLRVLPAVKECDITTSRYGERTIQTPRIAGYMYTSKNIVLNDDREDGAELDSEERFYGGLAGKSLKLKTNDTTTDIPVEHIESIEQPEESAGIVVILRDGGRLVGMTEDGTIGLLAGGQTWRVPTRRLVYWKAPEKPEPPEQDEKEDQPESGNNKKTGISEEETPVTEPPANVPPIDEKPRRRINQVPAPTRTEGQP